METNRAVVTAMSSHLMEIEGGVTHNRDDLGVEWADLPPLPISPPPEDADRRAISSGIPNLDQAMNDSGDESLGMRSQYTAEERRNLFLDAAAKL
jgi:hypothetical protein